MEDQLQNQENRAAATSSGNLQQNPVTVSNNPSANSMEISPENKIQSYFKDDLSRYILPDKYAYNCFDGQKDNEKALLYIRKHWIVELTTLAQAIFWMFTPIIALSAILIYFPGLLDSVITRIGIVLLHLVILFIALNWFIKWLDHHLDVIIVTNKRIVDVNQTRIFNRKISSMSLGQVQDVSGQTRGFIPSMLKFGVLNIETAGQGQLKQLMRNAMNTSGNKSGVASTGGIFELRYVYRCQRVATAILNIRDFYLKRAGRNEMNNT